LAELGIGAADLKRAVPRKSGPPACRASRKGLTKYGPGARGELPRVMGL